MKPIDKKSPAASNLAKQLGKRNAFDLIEEELFISLIRTVDIISRGFGDLFQKYKLTSSLYNALRIVAGECGVNEHGITVGMIASRLVCRNPDTTRLVDRLEKLGYVDCVTCPQDARRRMVRITGEGQSVLKALHKPVREIHRRQFSKLNKKTQQRLLELLEQARSSAEES
ncbi:MAG: MarR family transcriptional regulator [Pirellulales bacterium]